MQPGSKKRTGRALRAPGTTAPTRDLAWEALAWLFAGTLVFALAPSRVMADGPTLVNTTPAAPPIINETSNPVIGPNFSAGASSFFALSQLLANDNGGPLALGFRLAQGGSLTTANSGLTNLGVSFSFYAPAATDSAGAPLPGAVVPTTYGLTENLALTKTDGKAGDTGLLLNGMYYMSNGSHALIPGLTQAAMPSEEALSQGVSYKTQTVSFALNYRDVGKNFAGDDALKAMAAQNGAASLAAVNDLLSHKGQSDWNLDLGLANDHGAKFGFLMDNLTDQNAHTGTRSETFSFQDTFAGGLGLSASHAMVDRSPLLGGPAFETTTDNVHLALAPLRSGFSLNADQTFIHTTGGSESSQTKLDLAEHYRAVNLTGNFNMVDTGGLTSDHASTEQFQLSDTLSKTVSFTTTWNSASDLKNHCGDKNDFDAILKATLPRNLQTITEFYDKDEGNNRIQALQSSFQMPSFLGTKNASWKVGLTSQTTPQGQGTQKWDVALDSSVPTAKVALPPTLPGASLHFEYAGNIIGAVPGTEAPSTRQSSRALRIVSGPIRGNWLSWSIYQQDYSSAGGCTLPGVRDYMIQIAVLKGSTLTYTSNDQLPLPGGGIKDLKEQDLKLTTALRPKNAFQLTADYMHGTDRTDNLASTQAVSVGIAAQVTSKQSYDMSVGRTEQRAQDGGFANGTTYKVDYKWNQDSSHLLNLASTLTYWGSGGSRLVNCPVDATARLDFKTTY